MKRFILLFALFTITVSTAFADNDQPITVNQLPVVAKQFIEKYFPSANVSFAKMETELFNKSYDVIFTDGNKVEFDKNGEWKDIDCKFSQVPDGIVPQAMVDYVKTHHQNTQIIKIERDKQSHEIKLNNGLELKFNSKYKLIEIDN